MKDMKAGGIINASKSGVKMQCSLRRKMAAGTEMRFRRDHDELGSRLGLSGDM